MLVLACTIAILPSLLHICTGLTLEVSSVRCTQDGRPSAVPSLRFRHDRPQPPPHHVVLRVHDGGCLCSTSYRFIAKVTRRPAASGPVQIEVCLTDFQLFDDRVVLKRFHVPSGRKNTIIAFDGEGRHGPHCEVITLEYREVIEMRVKIRSSCEDQASESGSRFNATFRYMTEEGVTCPRPPSFANGAILPANRTSFQPREFVQYECNKNYSAVESDRWFSECGQDGRWTQPPPRCSSKDDWCPRVSLAIPHAIVAIPDSRSVHSVLRVTCTGGHFLHGLPHYSCQEDSTWSSATLMQHIMCSNQSNCPIPESDDVIVRGNGIYPGSFAKHCCRPGLEQYGCGAGLVCDACTAQYCSADQTRWTASSPQCRTVQPLWTRLYNSLFRSAMDMNASLAMSQQRCGSRRHADGAGPTEQSSTSESQVGVPLSIECSRSIGDLRACFDLAFLLDASLSIANDVFYNASLPFVRVVTNHFSIGRNRTRVSVLLFEEDSDFILEQETRSTTVYRTLSNISRPAMGNTNLRGGFEKFITRVALDVYNGSSSYRRQCKKVMFVLSDGNINDGGSPEAAASQLKQFGWEIYSIGIGDRNAGSRPWEFHSIASLPHYEYIFQLQHGQQRRGQCSLRRSCRNQGPHAARSAQHQRIEDFVQEVLPGQSDYSQCGRTDTPLTAFTGRARILGGTEARFGAYPWQVALIDKVSGKVFCSGTLICNGGCKWVLTAAHCFFEGGKTSKATRRLPRQILLRFGENDLTILEGSEFECGIARAVYHPGYDGWPANGDDVALLLPDCSFELSARRRCACLPTDADMPLLADGRTTEIAGWGAQTSDGNVHSTSHVLRWVKMRMIGRGACEKDRALKETMTCATGLAAETDSCRGDSGGALISRRANDSYVALAVLSYGQVDPRAPDVVCGRPGYYAIYTSILPYMSWIREKFKLATGCHPHLDDDDL